jgi:hypothetical protein
VTIDLTNVPKIEDELIINGVRVNSQALMGILIMIFNPLPDRWMRFEKQGDVMLVEVRHEEKPESGIVQ